MLECLELAESVEMTLSIKGDDDADLTRLGDEVVLAFDDDDDAEDEEEEEEEDDDSYVLLPPSLECVLRRFK